MTRNPEVALASFNEIADNVQLIETERRAECDAVYGKLSEPEFANDFSDEPHLLGAR